MMKFFRKIRQNLVSKGKTGKYLKYAIGEIVLVVIGILIALQINNWNDVRKINNQKHSLLQNIKKDLEVDTLNFAETISFLKENTDLKRSLLSLSSFDTVSNDNLFVLISARSTNQTVNTLTFDKLRSLGISKITDNEGLVTELDEYYINKSNILEAFLKWDTEESKETRDYWFFNQNQFEIDVKHFPIKNKSEIFQFGKPIQNRENLIHLLSEPRGRNYVKMDFVRKKLLLEQYRLIYQAAKTLIPKIETELNK
ncbi:DUF6090 family protein [Lutibacter sp. B1]|uniref:DUF6090 family protein n=1 Tax=Lutibacter sp. B1 TaxID=2725996 RepID=UPI001B3A40BE|nr:DUF6090 family protein [Lutibacter sp. B1]